MPDGFNVDSSELDKLAADIGLVPAKSGSYYRSAIEVSSTKVRNTARENATGLEHAPHFPRSITYDIDAFRGFGVTVLRSEIGPDKSLPQGALGNLIEYGSVNNPPQGILHGALQANEADFEHGIDRATEDALKALGL